MQTGGQDSRARPGLITGCPADALGSIGGLTRRQLFVSEKSGMDGDRGLLFRIRRFVI